MQQTLEILKCSVQCKFLSKNRILNDFLHSTHEIGAITNIVLKFNFWLEIHIELNTLGSIKYVAHVKEQPEGVRSISTQFQAIHSIKSANFFCISPLINIGKNTNRSLEKKL